MLSAQKISKSFGSQIVLQDLSLNLVSGEIALLYGASGSGKTTLLHIIAGLEKPDSGNVEIDGDETPKIWQTNWQRMAKKKPTVGIVFQELKLFPHLSVIANVNIGLDSAQKSTDKILGHAKALGIDKLLRKSVTTISRGEAQRVAVLRAAIRDPEILLLDEPTASLDENSKKALIDYIHQVRNDKQRATLIATHDLSLAKLFPSKILLLQNHTVQILENGAAVLERIH